MLDIELGRTEFRIRRKGHPAAAFPATRVWPVRGRKPPGWLRTEQGRCGDCPAAGGKTCSAAEAAEDIFDYLSDKSSAEIVQVQVKTNRFTAARRCGLSQALAPLLIVRLAQSDCPALQGFRPFLKVMLPTIPHQRAAQAIVGGFLLAEYAGGTGGGMPGLNRWLKEVTMAVRGLLNRLKLRCTEDAAFNALVHALIPIDHAQVMLAKEGVWRVFPELTALETRVHGGTDAPTDKIRAQE